MGAYTRGVSSGSGRPGTIAWCAAVALLVLVAVPVATASGDGTFRHKGTQPSGASEGGVRFATSGDHSEIRERVPIARRKWAKKRVAMTLGPAKLATLHRGDILRTSAEVQISNTCDFNAVRCIGRHYAFSPREDARLVIADRPGATGGRHATVIAQADSLRCRQRAADRNHHCVLVFPPKPTTIRHPRQLPCRPGACHLNLVLEADDRHADDGQVILVGEDRPNGTVGQDKGRLSAIILHGSVPPAKRFKTRKRRSRSIPIVPSGKAGRRVIYSQRINHLHKGDVLEASASHLVTISSLPYRAFVGTDLIVARDPHAISPAGIPRAVISGHGDITEQNGFNCTHGPSAYRSPRLTRKAGAVRVRHTPARHGDSIPLYLNLVAAGAPKGTTHADDHMRVLPGGALKVRRFRAP